MNKQIFHPSLINVYFLLLVIRDVKDDDVPTENSGLCTFDNLSSVKNINISKKPKYVISFIELVKVVTLVGEILLYITVTTPLSFRKQ